MSKLSTAIRKNGTIHNGKQTYHYLYCLKQFIEAPQNRVLAETREEIDRSLFAQVSLEGCRDFELGS